MTPPSGAGALTDRPHYLYVPGDQPDLLARATASDASALEIDLEDGVRPERKAEARAGARAFLAANGHGGRPVILRPNQLDSDHWWADLEATCEVADTYLLPYIRDAADVVRYDEALTELEGRFGLRAGSRKLYLVIETAAAVEHLPAVLDASPRTTGIVFGQFDYAVSVGSHVISDEGFTPSPVLEWTSSRLLVAAAARGLHALIGPWAPHGDRPRAVAEIRRLFNLGYHGMVIGTPDAVATVNEALQPSSGQREFAQGVVDAAAQAAAKGLGFTSYDGWMVEGVQVGMAQRLLTRAATGTSGSGA